MQAASAVDDTSGQTLLLPPDSGVWTSFTLRILAGLVCLLPGAGQGAGQAHARVPSISQAPPRAADQAGLVQPRSRPG